MNSFMHMIKLQNPDKEYPSNIGQKWTDEEEILLLEELKSNIDIERIAKKHNRTIGGISSRCREIAYKMYLNNVSMEEIMLKTKLEKIDITQTIDKKQNYAQKKAIEAKSKLPKENEIYEIKNDIKELKNSVQGLIEMYKIKNDITELKKSVQELIEMMKAVYIFEDV